MATQVYIGDDMSNPLFVFNSDNILSLVTHTAVNFMPQELTADTADIQVEYDGDGAIQEMNWATQVLIYNDSELFGKFYLTNVKRIGANRYEINAVSIVGLLEYETFYGQRYNRAAFKDVLEEILLTNGFRYCRFYSAIHRGLYGDSNNVFANRGLQGVQIQSGVNSYPMNSRVETHIKLNKFILNDLVYDTFQNLTSVRISLFGNCTTPEFDTLNTEQAASLRARRYGLFMDVSRESVEDEWPDFGEVFFVYGDNIFSLGTPTEPIDYEISVSPSDGTAIINGTTYNIVNNYPNNAVYALAWCCGGTIAGKHYTSGSVGTFAYAVCCDIEYGKYKIWNTDGTKLVDLIYTENPYSRILVANNMPSTTISGTINYSKFDREKSVFDGGSGEWVYNLRDNIVYGSNVDTVTIYGWIPVCTKRDALHQLLLATGVIMRKDDDGNIYFTSPTEASENQLSSDKIYNEGTQRNLEHTNRIEVTEHVFDVGDSSAREIVFKDSEQHNGAYVALYQTQPCTSLTFEGVNVLSYSANGAIVIGSGTISGIPTRHIETVLHRDIGESKDGRTVSINDATLISYHNSEAALDRLAAYYGNVYEVENSIVYENEKAGNLYSFTSPFRDQVTGYLAKVSTIFSKVTKASCQFICGYKPHGVDQYFMRVYILTGNGTFNIPQFVFERDNPKIRVVLIGGGQGGYSGYAGENGTVPVIGSSSNEPAKGGATGKPGSGGKVFTVDIDNPAHTYTCVIGEGGEGGAISRSNTTSNPGAFGSDTTFTDGTTLYSSAHGESSKEGVTNFFNGDKYAKQVIFYADGGDGGLCDSDGTDPRYVPSGEARLGLVKGEYAWYNNAYWYNYGEQFGKSYGSSKDLACGGGGGGAALTNNPGTTVGTKGGDASGYGNAFTTGNGGNGGNAEFVPLPALSIKSTYWGYGGQGGAGGGAGGSAGGGYHGGDHSITSGTPGKGGYGGVGGKGGNGCILVYC